MVDTELPTTGHWFFLVIPPFFLLYLSFFVIPILLIPNFLRYNKNWYNKSFTKYNQKWYNKYFQEISGITNWDINQNISCVVKYPKSFSMGGQRYCNFCVRNIENQNHFLGLDEENFWSSFGYTLGITKIGITKILVV